MDAISKYHDSKLFMGNVFPYLYFLFIYIVCILTLESNYFFIFVLGFEAQQKMLLF